MLRLNHTPGPVRPFTGLLSALLLGLLAAAVQPQTARAAASTGTDILLIIDDSGSMKTNDRRYWRKKAALIIAAYARPQDRAAVVVYDHDAYDLLGDFVKLTEEGKWKVYSKLMAFRHGGKTDFRKAFQMGRRILASRQGKNAERPVLVLFLTDGDARPPDMDDLAMFRKKGWLVNGVALGHNANLDRVTEICRYTGGVAQKTFEAEEITDFFLSVYQARTGEATSPVERRQEMGRTVLKPQARYGQENPWTDLSFVVLFDTEDREPGAVLELREHGKVVWDSRRGQIEPDLEIERSAAQWNLYGRGSIEVMRVRNPRHADWALVVSGEPKAHRISFTPQSRPQPIHALPHPGRPLPAMLVFRDETGLVQRNEAFYGTIARVTAHLKLIDQGEISETIELTRGARQEDPPPDIAPEELPYAYWNYFSRRPAPEVPFIIEYHVEYNDGSYQRPLGMVNQIPKLGLIAEPGRFVLESYDEEVVLQANVSLVGDLPDGDWQISLPAASLEASDFWLAGANRRLLIPAERVKVSADPQSQRISDIGAFRARVRVRLPLPDLTTWSSGKISGQVQIATPHRTLGIAPTRLNIEVSRRFQLDLQPPAVVRPVQGQEGVYWKQELEVAANVRGGQVLPTNPHVEITRPDGTTTQLSLHRSGRAYASTFTPEQVGTYTFLLPPAPDKTWMIGDDRQTVEVKPHGARALIGPERPKTGQTVRFRVVPTPGATPFESVSAVLERPDGERAELTLQRSDGGYYEGSYEQTDQAGTYKFITQPQTGLDPDKARGRFAIDLPRATLVASPPQTQWGHEVVLKLSGTDAPLTFEDATVVVTDPQGQSEELTLQKDGPSFAGAFKPRRVGSYEVAPSPALARKVSLQEAALEIQSQPLSGSAELAADEALWGEAVTVRARLQNPPEGLAEAVPEIPVELQAEGGEPLTATLRPTDAPGRYAGEVQPRTTGQLSLRVPDHPQQLYTFTVGNQTLTANARRAMLRVTPGDPVLYWQDEVQLRGELDPPAPAELVPALSVQAAKQDGPTTSVQLQRQQDGSYAADAPLALGAGPATWVLQIPADPEGAYEASQAVTVRRAVIHLESETPEIYVGQPVRWTARLDPAPETNPTSRFQLIFTRPEAEPVSVPMPAATPGTFTTAPVALQQTGDWQARIYKTDGGELPTEPVAFTVRPPDLQAQVTPPPGEEPLLLGGEDAFACDVTVSAENLYIPYDVAVGLGSDSRQAEKLRVELAGQPAGVVPAQTNLRLEPDAEHRATGSVRIEATADEGALAWWPGSDFELDVEVDAREAATYPVRGAVPAWAWQALYAAAAILALLLLYLLLRALFGPRWRQELVLPHRAGQPPVRVRELGGRRKAELTPPGVRLKVNGWRWNPRYRARANDASATLAIGDQPLDRKARPLADGQAVVDRARPQDGFTLLSGPDAMPEWGEEILYRTGVQPEALVLKSRAQGLDATVSELGVTIRKVGTQQHPLYLLDASAAGGGLPPHVNGQPAVGIVPLQPGDEITLGDPGSSTLDDTQAAWVFHLIPDAVYRWQKEALLPLDAQGRPHYLRELTETWEAVVPEAGVLLRRQVTDSGLRYFAGAAPERPSDMAPPQFGSQTLTQELTPIQAGQEFGLPGGPRYLLMDDEDKLPKWKLEIFVSDIDDDHSIFVRRMTRNWTAVLESIGVEVRKAGTSRSPLYFIRALPGAQTWLNGQPLPREWRQLNEGDVVGRKGVGRGEVRFQRDIPVEGDDSLYIDEHESLD